MIAVTRLKGQTVAINPDLIECVESNPDTTVRLTSGEKLIVRESLDEIIARVAEYRRYLLSAFAITPRSSRPLPSPTRPGRIEEEE